ncbi:hypothetical protein QZH41_012011 [Actinostola sp. cb2023]|nr:hypothetical protein QZH41_012011 [Actinostola sp. cb2023]
MDARMLRVSSTVLQHLLGEMLTGVTWQMIIILLVLIEVVVNIILLLINFHVIRDSEDHFASNILHFIAISILALFVLEVSQRDINDYYVIDICLQMQTFLVVRFS